MAKRILLTKVCLVAASLVVGVFFFVTWSMVASGTASAVTTRPAMTLVLTNPTDVSLPLVDANNLPVTDGGSQINWGDGSVNSSLSHHYAALGTYTVTITASSQVVGFGSASATPLVALTSVTSWSGPWQSFAYAFNGAITLQHVPSTLPGTVSNLSYMFDGATSFNGTLATWDTSAVTTMAGMFEGATSFNQPLPWATYNVTDMSYMFQGASAFNSPLFSQTALVTSMSFMFASDPVFNQPLSNWQTGAVTDLSFMFQNASAFNQPIGNWNVANVTNLNGLFQFASSFDQPLNAWNTSNVTQMDYVFQQDTAFNKPLANWSTTNVQEMIFTFSGATSFNQPLGSWDTSSVTTTNGMFANASSFNQPLENWSMGLVTDASYMFLDATAFNEPLAGWRTQALTTADGMFELASSFNQPLTAWDLSSCTSMAAMFLGATSFDSAVFTTTPNVTNMSGMFQGDTAFNRSLTGLATQSVTDMSGMFAGATSFNSPLFSDVHNVTTMAYMFAGASDFNQPLNAWKTTNVTDLSFTFAYDPSFNQALAWDTSNVVTLNGTFSYATAFNAPLETWNVSRVANLNATFQGATAFNQPLGKWDTSSVTDMSGTFASATAFNQPLATWRTANVTDMSYLFQGATSFAQNISRWSVGNVVNFTNRCQGVVTCNLSALNFTLTGSPLGGFSNAYQVTLTIPAGSTPPTGTLTISDNGALACSSSAWTDLGAAVGGGERYGAGCTDPNIEFAGDVITAQYQGGGNQDPTSQFNYGSDYGVSLVPTITIAQVTLYVVPTAQSINYADAAPDFTFAYHLNSPTGPLLEVSVASEPYCTSDYDGTWNAGTYANAITCATGYDPNYVFDTSSTASLTIRPILLYVVPDAQQVNYGDAVPDYTYALFTDSPTGSPASVALVQSPTCTSPYSATTTVPDSPLTIRCQAGQDPNYVFNVSSTASITVSPDTLFVVPDDQSMIYGDAVPPYTYSFHLGATDGPVVAVAPSSSPTCASPYGPLSSVALSPLTINCQGGRDPNYVFDTTTSARLTIDQATPTIRFTSTPSSTAYGSVYTVTYSLTKGDLGKVTVTSSNPACAVNGMKVTLTAGTGQCSLTVSATSDGNFVGVLTTQDLTLSKVTLFVVPSAVAVNALSPVPSYPFAYHTGSATGPVVTPSIQVTPVCASGYSATTSAALSPLTVRCNYGTDLNYAFNESATSNLTIARIAPTPLQITAATSGVAGTALVLTATGGAGSLPTTYTVAGLGCTLQGSSLMASGATDCQVSAHNAQTDYYVATSSPPVTIHFAWALQATLSITSATTAVAGQTVTLTTAGGSGVVAPQFHVSGTSCFLSGRSLTVSSGTTCTVTANNPGNGIYASVSSAAVSVAFTPSRQALVAISSPTVAVIGAPLTLTATGGSGVKSYHYQVTGDGCSVRAGLLSATRTGICTVTAVNAANGIYASANSLPVTVTIASPHGQSLYVLFGAGSSTLTTADQASLTRYATSLKGAHVTSVFVAGYVNASNASLATQRAQATASYLRSALQSLGLSSVTLSVTTQPAQLKWAFGLNAVYVSN